MFTNAWFSSVVVNVFAALIGMVEFFSMMRENLPPSTSMPSECGVTSSSTTSCTVPSNTPACVAAPSATTSSGFTPRNDCWSKNSSTLSCTNGMRVVPPTKITRLMSFFARPASSSARLQQRIVRRTKSSIRSSNSSRVITRSRCNGWPLTYVRNGSAIVAWFVVESSHFARSATSFSRRSVTGSSVRSTLYWS